MKEVFVLGSGASISELTEEEKAHINQAEVRIAVNKFAAFYKKAGIVPTHVFFVDVHSPSATDMLQHIFDLCVEDGLADMRFVVNSKVKDRIFVNKNLAYYFHKYHPKSVYKHHPYYWTQRQFAMDFVTLYKFLEGGEWAVDLQQKLFHFRSSLSSVFNYVGVCFPGTVIKLVGVDLNGKDYFFEDDLRALSFSTSDWTTTHTKREEKHFTVQDYQGTNFLDKFPYMLEELSKTNNTLLCCGASSLLVEKELVEYQPILGAPGLV